MLLVMQRVTVGAVIAGFRIESLIGEGAMGAVYLAEDGEGRRVALKLLSPELARDERFRQRFLRESQLATSLDHPHIVSTVAYGEEDGTLYLAMVYVDGCDLRDLLRREGRLEPERAIQIVGQIAEALDAAHAAGLVHRDVKPGNILLDRDSAAERGYVCDFGLARHVTSVSSLTGERGFVGTIDYVPPEQIEGGPIDRRADIYSLGCVLFECLGGQRPFERDSELSVVFAHLNEPPPRLTELQPELPATFDQVFQTALAKSPDDRYSSCGELATAARAALQGKVLARRRPRRLAVVAIATVVVAAAGTTAGLLLTRGSPDTLPLTISPTSIAGARLGDSNFTLGRMWNGGQKLAMQEPPDYSVLRQSTRNVSAYFIGTTDKTVEIVTWNSRDRTAEGIGPCSTVEELKRAYGNRLKASPNNTHNGVVSGWLLGSRLFFAMGPTPEIVNAVALYSNPSGLAGFNALNEGPCGPAANTTPVKRPANIPVATTPALPTKLSSRSFTPRVALQVPRGWTRRSDTNLEFSVGSLAGPSVEVWLDPLAATPDGRTLSDVWTSPRALTTWLKGRSDLVVTTPDIVKLGKPALTATSVDVRLTSGDPGTSRLVFAFRRGDASALRSRRDRPLRLYLVPIRIGTTVHTLAIVLEAPSKQTFRAVQPIATAIVESLKVDAAAAGNLSALSSFCTPVFYGTCLGELTAGTHKSRSFQPGLTYTVPIGWTNFTDHNGVVGLIPPGGDFSVADDGKSDRIDAFTSIATGMCGTGPGTGHTPDAFLRWIRQQPGFAPIQPRAATIGGLSGYVVDLRMRDASAGPCPGDPGQPVLTGLPPSPEGLNFWIMPRPMVMRLYLLHYKGGTLGIEITELQGSSKLAAYSDIVKTFRFALG